MTNNKGIYPLLLGFAVLSLVGLLLVPRLSVQLAPSGGGQNITVSYTWAGASPLMLEAQVTALLEGTFSTVQGVQKVSSVSSYGYGYVSLELDKNADADALRLEVASLVRQVYKRLPAEMSYPQVALNTPNQQDRQKPLLTLQLDGPDAAATLLRYAEEQLKPTLAQVRGVYQVEVSGGNRQEWVVSYDADALKSLQLTENQIINSIQQHFRQEALGSLTQPNGQRLLVSLAHASPPSPTRMESSHGRAENEAKNPPLHVERGLGGEALRAIPIANLSGRIVRLGEVATISRQEQPATAFYRVNGQNALNLTLAAAAGANQLQVAQEVRKRITSLQQQLPAGYQLRTEYDATQYIEENLQRIGIQSGFAVLILFLFVLLTTRSWQYMALIGVSMAVCLLLSVILFYAFNVEIHLYSLAALTTSLGIIIDNVIVMIDHYRRYRNLRVFSALLGATLTTCAGLAVIWFLPDEARIDLLDFAVVMVITLGVSLVVAVGFVPALMDSFSKSTALTNPEPQKATLPRGEALYRDILHLLVRFCKTVIVAGILLFGTPIFLLPNQLDKESSLATYYNPLFGNEWFNDEIRPVLNKWLGGTLRLFVNYVYEGAYFGKPERTALYVVAELPNNSTIEQMNLVFERLENELKTYPEVDRFMTQIYNGQQGSMVVYFKKNHEDGSFPYQLKNRIIALSTEMSGISWNIYGVGQGFSQSLEENQTPSFNVRMLGYNYQELEDQATRLKTLLEAHPRIQEVNINRGMSLFSNKNLYEYAFQTQNSRLAMHNTTLLGIYEGLHLRSNHPTADVYTFIENQYEPIKVIPTQAQAFDVYQLTNQPFQSGSASYKLNTLATVTKEKVIPEIFKEDQQYVRMVSFEYFGSGHFGDKFLTKTLDEFRPTLPVGYTVKKSEYNWFSEEARKQYELIGLVMVLIYIICAVIFESLLQPLALIGMIPLSYIGVFLAFYWFDYNFDQGGYASFVLLAGNVVCAGIFIISEWNILQKFDPKSPPFTLYIRAFQHKIRPILLTVLSTIVGLIPFLLYENEPFWFALGVGTIGGLLMSLLVLLFFLPVFLMNKRDFYTNDYIYT
jgi:multidrug efflux pump subunit AcrB